MFFGALLAFLAGGVIGWWFGSIRSKNATERKWMEALEAMHTDGIINEEQRSQIIRSEGTKE